jgi:ribokinase
VARGGRATVPWYRRAVRLAVVGHVEWIRFARVHSVPPAGGIEHALEAWEGAGGGGGVAATQLAKLGGGCLFFTALGRDRIADDARNELQANGVDVRAAIRDEPTRTALTMIDDAGERTIVTLGERLQPVAADPLPWERIGGADGVFFTAGDADALRAARAARVLVATSRVMDVLRDAAVELDAVVGSELDPAERYEPIDPPPALVVRTRGRRGGSWETADGRRGRYDAAAPPGPIVDTYGAGDSFQAGLTFGLAKGAGVEDALALAARCGAAAVAGRGPTGGQLRAADLRP